MEKIIFKNSRNQSLVGHFYASESESIIIMSHGFTGDKSEWGRFDKIAESFNQSGYNVLTFDFSGCGESDDDTLAVNKQVDDLKSAIKFVKSKGYRNIGLFGRSLGGLISIKCFTPEIITMVLCAPVTNKIIYSWDKRYSEEQLQEFDEKGYITKTIDKGVRKTILIDKQMLADREIVNQKDLLKNIDCPILIIHGKQDGNVPYTDSEEAIKLLPKDSKLELINKADHRFYDYLDTIVNLSTDWFLNHLEH